ITVKPHETACYRCLFNEPPPPGSVPTCSSVGIMGAIAGMLGSIQAAEAIKSISGVGTPLHNILLHFDAKTMDFRKMTVRRNRQCPICGENPSITKLVDGAQAICNLKGKHAHAQN